MYIKKQYLFATIFNPSNSFSFHSDGLNQANLLENS